MYYRLNAGPVRKELFKSRPMIKSLVEKHLVPKHEFLYGFADLHGLMHHKFSDYSFGISIARKLDPLITNKLSDGPTLEYFNHYKIVNKELADLTHRIRKDLLNHKIDSFAVEPTIALSSKQNHKYLNSLTYELSHKMVATRAGLGWIGKTDLLVTKEFGPRIRLVTLLLDRDPGIESRSINSSRCGNCTICVDKCPARAANGLLWDIKVHRDTFFDAFKCRKKCGELAKQKLNVNEHICGLCVSVCPVGKNN